MTMTPPEPAMFCTALRASNSSATSISLAASTGADEPPGMTAFTFRPAGMPWPKSGLSMSSRTVVLSITSKTPGRFTEPDRQTIRVPPDFSGPSFANQSAPFWKMVGTAARVSTLFTTVGQPKRPTTAGKGGLSRGQPFFPSRDSSIPVSSPQMYAPAPRTT